MASSLLGRGLIAVFVIGATVILSTSTNMRATKEAWNVASMSRVRQLTLPHGSAVLVTGGAGFVGYHLSMRLHQLGVHVVALDNFDPYYSISLKRARQQRLQAAGIEVVEADMCNGDKLAELLHRHEPPFSHVASMAAQAGVRYSLVRPQNYVRANVQCFVTLLEAIRQQPSIRLVYASSSSVYGANTKTPFAEDDRTDAPNSLYAATKKTNEQLAHVYHGLYGIRVTGLRFFTVYGPWGRPDMAYFSFAHKIATGKPIQVYGHGKPQRDFTYIDDVVEGIVGALALGADEEIFNLGNHRVETLHRFISVLEAELGKVANKTEVGMAPGDVMTTYAEVQRARDRIGYVPRTSIEEGLKQFVKWYKSDHFKPEYAEEGEWRRKPTSRSDGPTIHA